jgi:hypothetical protein
MDRQFLKPAPGMKVRHPQTRLHLAEAGQFVELDTYWHRRIADGDVVVCEAPAADAAEQE